MLIQALHSPAAQLPPRTSKTSLLQPDSQEKEPGSSICPLRVRRALQQNLDTFCMSYYLPQGVCGEGLLIPFTGRKAVPGNPGKQ